MTLPLAAILQRLFGTLCLILVGVGVSAYPFPPFPLVMGLMAYGSIGLWRPIYLLFVLPVCLTLVNLAPWSGSLYLEEYDLILGLTLGAFLLRGRYSSHLGRTRVQWWFLGLLVIAYGISLARGLLPIPSWNPIELSSLFSSWNALRVGKGFFWALALLPGLAALVRDDEARARHGLLWGLAVSCLVIGLLALWERGVLYAILSAQGRWAVINSLLNFSTQYRITGLFSEMHTGGAAIDSFIALAWPFALLAFSTSRTKVAMALGGGCLVGGLYAGVVTFSRATYLALLVGFVTVALLWLYGGKQRVDAQRRPYWTSLAGFMVLPAMPYLFMRGGLRALVSGLMIWAACFVAGYLWKSRTKDGRIVLGIAATVVVAVSALLIHHYLLTSRWVENTLGQALLVALAYSALGTAGGWWSGSRLAPVIGLRSVVMIVAALIGAMGIATPAALGSYMAERTSTSEEDLNTRIEHWRQAIDIMPAGWETALFGVGLGTFPVTNLLARSQPANMGTYEFLPEGKGYFLRLGGGQDARLTQIVDLPAFKRYTLTMDVRTSDPKVWLRARLYRRNVLILSDWQGANASFGKTVENTKGQWQQLTWTFNIGSLGDDGVLGRLPLVLELMNLRMYVYMLRPNTLIDVDNVTIKDEAGHEYIKNGNFDRGMEHWLPHYDFNHLPWHIKNLWVNIFFDQGLLGLVAFMGFVVASLYDAVRRALDGDEWCLGVSAAVASFLAVGLFGTLMDVPRIFFLFWLITFVTALTGARPTPRSWARRSRAGPSGLPAGGRRSLRRRSPPV